jgi:hypothetical protein
LNRIAVMPRSPPSYLTPADASATKEAPRSTPPGSPTSSDERPAAARTQMIQSNDPAEVPISIHDGDSRVNVNVPNRRTSPRDGCTCSIIFSARDTTCGRPST